MELKRDRGLKPSAPGALKKGVGTRWRGPPGSSSWLAVFFTAALWAVRPVFCAQSAGGQPFDFLFLDAGARSVAMGGAYTAIATDANALLYNPAGLGRVAQNEATVMHNQYFAGITQEYLGFAAAKGWGLNFNYLDFGSIEQTTLSNPNGSGLGYAGLTDWAASAGYGHDVGYGVSLGVAAKYITEDIAGISGHAEAADAGVLYDVPLLDGLTVGAALQNMGPGVRFQGASESLPLNARFGAAYRFSLLGQDGVVSLEADKERSDAATISAGAEVVVLGVLPLRAGYDGKNDAGSGLSLGTGWKFKNVSVDYAFVPFGSLGTANYISLSLRWGGPAEVEKADDAAIDDDFMRADGFLDEGLPDQAREAAEEARALMPPGDPRMVRYFDVLGHIAWSTRDAAAAEKNFRAAVDAVQASGLMDEYAAYAYTGLGLCRLEDKDKAGAAKDFEVALHAMPTERNRELIEKELQGLNGAAGIK